mmetsp:Transcript_12337/g.18993  ORF Transcript_12337/g.18993 Transcript_12337/m.18993 type:complete len:771 (-) Transcript_12337:482-2794(-)
MPPPPPRLRVEVLVLLLGSGGRGAPRAAGRATLGEGEGGQRAAGPRDLAARLLQRLREGGVLLQVPVGHGPARVAHGRLEVPGQDLGHGVLLLHVLHVLAGLRAQPLALHVAHDVLADGQLGRPLADLRQVRPGELLRLGRQVAQVHVLVHGGLAQRGLQDADARLQVGHGDVDQLVQPAGAGHGVVQDVRPVGRADDEDGLARAHAVDLRQDLVDHAVAGVRAARAARAAGLGDGVHLVEEQDAGRGGPRLVEEVAHISLGLAEPHGQQLGALHGDEVRVALVGDGLGQQGLAAAGRPVEEHALGGAHAELLELARVLHGVLHQLLQLALDVLQAADVVPGHVRHLHGHLAQRRGVAHLHGLVEVLLGDLQPAQHLLGDALRVDVDLVRGLPHAQQRRLHAQLRQVRPNVPVRLRGNVGQVQLGAALHLLALDLEDLQPARVVRDAQVDLAVEAAEAAKGGLDDVRPVGGRDHHHLRGGLDGVHQRQQLGDDALLHLALRLLALGCDGVNLVQEDDRRLVLLRLLEGLAQVALGLAGQLAHHLGPVDGDQEAARLGGHRLGHHGLAAAGGPVEQHAPGRGHAHRGEQRGVPQGQLDELADGVQLPLDAAQVVVAHLVLPVVLQPAQGLLVHLDVRVRHHQAELHVLALHVVDHGHLELHLRPVLVGGHKGVLHAQGTVGAGEVGGDEVLKEVHVLAAPGQLLQVLLVGGHGHRFAVLHLRRHLHVGHVTKVQPEVRFHRFGQTAAVVLHRGVRNHGSQRLPSAPPLYQD